MGFKRILAGAGVVAASVAAGQVAEAAGAAGACHARKDATAYQFNGEVEADTGDAPHGEWEVVRHTGFFILGGDLNGPGDAKNDYVIELRDHNTGETLFQDDTPDDIDFGEVYSEEPVGWFVDDGRLVYARFMAAFDKRNTGDAHCVADTPSFTFIAPPDQRVCLDEACDLPPGAVIPGGG
ncbi:MAG TPA: hypothetical protein VF230_03985 [Acidimicrobiales bacterium]